MLRRVSSVRTPKHCNASRCFSLAARVPYLHDLVGDERQPGILGGFGVKAVALSDINTGEIVFQEQGEIFAQPSMHSIQICVDRHCQIDGEGRVRRALKYWS